jgi:transposase
MPRRTPFKALPLNAIAGCELCHNTKIAITSRAAAGQTAREIEAAENTPKSIINSLLQRTKQRNTIENWPRSGHPKSYTHQDERMVIRIARRIPKCTYTTLRKQSGLDLSTKVLRRILQDAGILNWRSKRRHELTAEHARLRLQFARQWINSDWSATLFSDECSVEKGVGKELTWSFGYPQEKWHHNKVDEYPKGKQGSVMIWAVIGGTGTARRRSELIIMEHNPQSKRCGYTTMSYLNTLEAGLLPIYDGELYM